MSLQKALKIYYMKLIINNTVKAFLCNLSSRALHLRSFVSSYYLAKKITFHNFTGDRNKTYCEECYKYYIIGDDFYLKDKNVYNFEKFKWGGVKLDHLSYIYFDLCEFKKINFNESFSFNQLTIVYSNSIDISCFTSSFKVSIFK